MKKTEAEKLVAWMIENASRIAYGEITVKIVKHADRIKLIEKTASEKELGNG